MKLDRDLQLEILKSLESTYPEDISDEEWGNLSARHDATVIRANLFYLHEHGLIDWQVTDAGFRVRATHHGMDFLAGDGGLTAILGVVTVQLHTDTIKALIESRIEGSDLDPADKPRLVDALRSLPADATKHLAMKLVDLGLAHAPGALHAIQTALHLT
ncbi:hypothetical protein [Burkholderia glumae]|uniref:hypothetical protein n=1 Tax=Burkholderia glumae TaxID=337 RepID=UPI0012950698|nr:hypothetical protein [Burkholderia glumae]QGA39326.1 hypothetical protein GAS19_07780 [Burkholderia glumae]